MKELRDNFIFKEILMSKKSNHANGDRYFEIASKRSTKMEDYRTYNISFLFHVSPKPKTPSSR